MQNNSIQLCVVMPVYNEEGCIGDVVEKWASLAKEYSGSLLVIDDGASDKTPLILQTKSISLPNLIIVTQKNAGHGKAILAGYKKAINLRAEYIFQVDSDDQFTTEDFVKLWAMRQKSDFITGYRHKRYDNWLRLGITKILRTICFLVFGIDLKDSNIPYRLIKSDLLAKLLPLIPKEMFAPNIALAVLAKKAGYDLKEIPITHKERQTGTVSLGNFKILKVCALCFYQLIKLRLNKSVKVEKFTAESQLPINSHQSAN